MAGCSPAAVATSSQPGDKPFLLHVNGIGGERSIDHSLISGLQAGGFDAEVEYFDWTHGEDGLVVLRAYDRNRQEAEKVRDIIVRHAKERPNQPIYLSCHSGGVGIVVWAMEDLPPEVKVEWLLMLAPALSPSYDLSKALSHVKGKAYAFTSPYDTIILKTGTKFFGTMDRKYIEAAGLDGFVKPPGADDRQYAKLVAQPYQAQWLRMYGNPGTHIGATGTKFAREYIAPLLRTGRPPIQASTALTRPTARAS